MGIWGPRSSITASFAEGGLSSALVSAFLMMGGALCCESDSRCLIVVLKPSVMWDRISGGGGGGAVVCATKAELWDAFSVGCSG